MNETIRKCDTGAWIRIPATLLDAANMSIGLKVKLRVEDGRLIIQRLAQPRYDLDTLVSEIADENRHDLVLERRPVGGEIW